MTGALSGQQLETRLAQALSSVFRPIDEDGFWDPDRGTFTRGLEYRLVGEDIHWYPDRAQHWRYGPFGLMGTMHWRYSDPGTPEYDAQLRQALDHAATRISEGSIDQLPSYGLGALLASFAMASEVFDGNEAYSQVARDLYEQVSPLAPHSHSEDVLLTFGAGFHLENTEDQHIAEDVESAVADISSSVTDGRLSIAGDSRPGWSRHGNTLTALYDRIYGGSRPLRHQNQMYGIWALCRGCASTGLSAPLGQAEAVLDYTVSHRMQSDGGILWEDVPLRGRATGEALARLGIRPPHWKFLYSCHQTFFVNAVLEYYRAGGTRSYDRAVAMAMDWIFGSNVRGEDLVELSGIGVPMRQMTTDGSITISDQMYVGTYEVGSYIMALTNLLDRPTQDGVRVESTVDRVDIEP